MLGQDGIDRSFFFSLPAEVRLEMVREWRHEYLSAVLI